MAVIAETLDKLYTQFYIKNDREKGYLKND